MKKPITPYTHGVLDHATNLMVAAAPRLMRFPKRARRVTYGVAGGLAALAMLTDYPLAAKRAIPFKAHGLSDATLALALPAIPWLLGFARHRRARNFFLGLTAVTVAASLLTDWNKKSERVARRRHKRRPRLAA